MIMCELIYQAYAAKKAKARKALVRRWAIDVCVVTAAASLGVLAGVLIAPKSGAEMRADLRKTISKTANTIEQALPDIPSDKKKP